MTKEFTPKFRKGARLVCVVGSEYLIEGRQYIALKDSWINSFNDQFVSVIDDANVLQERSARIFQQPKPEQTKEKQVTITLDESVAREFLETIKTVSWMSSPIEYFMKTIIKTVEQALPIREVRHLEPRLCPYCESHLQPLNFENQYWLWRCRDQNNKACKAEWLELDQPYRFPDGELVETEHG